MPVKGSFSKKTILAHNDMDRLGINPIELIFDVYKESMAAYKSARGLSEKGDAGAAYLAVAAKAASDLASYKHPKLSAIAIQDMNQGEERKALTTQDAINIIKKDPFAPKEVQEIDTSRVLEALESTIQNPSLPAGDKNE